MLTRRRGADQAGIERRAESGSDKKLGVADWLLSPSQPANEPVYPSRNARGPNGPAWRRLGYLTNVPLDPEFAALRQRRN
ncbi:hypothetical protein [Cerasicoccus frondis]|uniref:hypothetical protein n=1 Tax=Cerasicoccus frondis TaxID=490090 RepID=UPI0028525841|nr:hypothetical protein [Cerasicoccus frondis]